MRRSLILALALAGCSDDAEPCRGAGVICAVAGTGEAAFDGDGHAPLETSFYLPSAVRHGPDGLLHVMDFNNMRLRRLRAEGVVDTVAGSGLHQLATVDVPATESGLENPVDFAFDDDGRIVLVSIHDPRVLVVSADGALTSIAGGLMPGDEGDGGPAVDATFTELWGLARAPDGTLYVSDGLTNRVRVLHPDGTIDACAGTGAEGYDGDGGPASAAALYHPQGLALDADGNLLIADSYNHAIRRVDADTGVITTVAGTGTPGLSGDGGPATEAELRFPAGVEPAPDGSIYIADTFNHRIRRIDADGVITTFAGTDKGHEGDGGPATAAKLTGPASVHATPDALYVADQQNHVVRVIYLH